MPHLNTRRKIRLQRYSGVLFTLCDTRSRLPQKKPHQDTLLECCTHEKAHKHRSQRRAQITKCCCVCVLLCASEMMLRPCVLYYTDDAVCVFRYVNTTLVSRPHTYEYYVLSTKRWRANTHCVLTCTVCSAPTTSTFHASVVVT